MASGLLTVSRILAIDMRVTKVNDFEVTLFFVFSHPLDRFPVTLFAQAVNSEIA